MRIGVLASVAHRTPPRDYGPWEQVASTLTEGFVAAGHDVTLYATSDSMTTARLRGTAPRGYEEDPDVDARVWGALHIARAFEDADDLDILANHFDFVPLTYSRLVRTPMVTTIHGFSSPRILPVFRAYDDVAHYVAISAADRHPDLTYAATIHHGIDTAAFSIGAGPRTHLLFLGRIHPDKGTDAAIEVADRTGIPLTIAGIVQDQAYFDEVVRPRVDGRHVTYVGSVGPDERQRLLGSAVALLHLVRSRSRSACRWWKPLLPGLRSSRIRSGSLPEIVRPGSTGFFVDDVAGRRRLWRCSAASTRPAAEPTPSSASTRRAWCVPTSRCSSASFASEGEDESPFRRPFPVLAHFRPSSQGLPDSSPCRVPGCAQVPDVARRVQTCAQRHQPARGTPDRACHALTHAPAASPGSALDMCPALHCGSSLPSLNTGPLVGG